MEEQGAYVRFAPMEGTPSRSRLVPFSTAACVAVILACLPTWAITAQVAKMNTAAVFDDWGMQLDAVDRLQLTVDVLVGVMVPLVLAVLAANLALAWQKANGGVPGLEGASTLKGYLKANWLLTCINSALALALALTMAGMFAWMLDMSIAKDAAGSGGGMPPWGPWPPVAAPAPGAAIIAHAPAAPLPVLAPSSSGVDTCPPECLDLGPIGHMMGLPAPCFCKGWLPKDLSKKLGQVVGTLVVSFLAALVMMITASIMVVQLAVEYVRTECSAGRGGAALLR